MKTKLFLASLLIGLNVTAQTQACFSTPDGVDASSGWSYKDYVIPSGFKIDSVYMGATRPGYPTSDYDFVFSSCAGTTTYSQSIATQPFNYSTDNNSEYNIWINLTSFNYISTGMVRVSLPVNAGAVWNQVCFAISSLNTPCFLTPDGIDASSWSYKDFIISSGYKIDSVYMDATRPGYATSDYDFVFAFCSGTTTYNQSIATHPFNYGTDTSSEYNHWINLTSFNYTSTGMARVSLPTNAGAVWNQVCFATSLQGTTTIKNLLVNNNQLSIYPNPATNYFIIQTNGKVNMIDILTPDGRTIKSFSNSNSIDISELMTGLYFIKTNIEGQVTVTKLIKE
jgi:hypothetical protein